MLFCQHFEHKTDVLFSFQDVFGWGKQWCCSLGRWARWVRWSLSTSKWVDSDSTQLQKVNQASELCSGLQHFCCCCCCCFFGVFWMQAIKLLNRTVMSSRDLDQQTKRENKHLIYPQNVYFIITTSSLYNCLITYLVSALCVHALWFLWFL